MSAKIVMVGPNWMSPAETFQRLWFYPYGSEYLKYSAHFHLIKESGFRMNVPLLNMFVVVLEGKLSVKDFRGNTLQRVDIRDQVWYARGLADRASELYAKTIRLSVSSTIT